MITIRGHGSKWHTRALKVLANSFGSILTMLLSLPPLRRLERVSDDNMQVKLDYNVKKQEAAYFIVFVNAHEGLEAEVLLNYELKRTVYDLQKEDPTCGADTGTTTCWFTIHLFDNRVLVVEARDSLDDTTDERFRFSWRMYPRWWIYLSLLAVPLFYLFVCVMPACYGWPGASTKEESVEVQYEQPDPPAAQPAPQYNRTASPQVSAFCSTWTFSASSAHPHLCLRLDVQTAASATSVRDVRKRGAVGATTTAVVSLFVLFSSSFTPLFRLTCHAKQNGTFLGFAREKKSNETTVTVKAQN